MKSFIAIAFFANLIINGLASFENCDIGEDLGLLYIYTNNPVNDDFSGVLKEFKADGITNITLKNNKYFDAKLENEKIVVFTKDDFKEFEYEVASKSNLKLSFKLIVECANGTTELTFQQPIVDTNNHEPFFNRKVYNYKFGMNVEAGFEVTDILSILATDVDMSTRNLEFSFETPNEYFEFTEKYFTTELAKTYMAGLKTKKTLTKMTKSFDIIVTDDGEPKKTGKAKINITVE